MISNFCTSCCVRKSHRLSSHASTSVYSPLELVFTNLWGPSHLTSYSGFKYYVSFIDAFSRYTWTFPIKTKVEIVYVFQTFKLSVEIQLNTQIKSVQCDWDGEYRLFSALLASYGISHRLIFPYTHHQNGVVERKHRHIVDLGLTLLHHATLPLQFWDYAFVTVVYLINRLPIASLNYSNSKFFATTNLNELNSIHTCVFCELTFYKFEERNYYIVYNCEILVTLQVIYITIFFNL